MKQHIYKSVRHFKRFNKTLYSWDVVNEGLVNLPPAHCANLGS